MYAIDCYCWVLILVTVFMYSLGLYGVIIAFIRYPIQTGVVHAAYVAFHLCDVTLVYFFHRVLEKKIYHWRFLYVEFAVSFLVALLQRSVVATNWFTTWAVLSFVHCLIFNIMKIFTSSDENDVPREENDDENDVPREENDDENDVPREENDDENDVPREENDDENDVPREENDDENDVPREENDDENDVPREEMTPKMMSQGKKMTTKMMSQGKKMTTKMMSQGKKIGLTQSTVKYRLDRRLSHIVKSSSLKFTFGHQNKSFGGKKKHLNMTTG
uniref:Uncharacterized protein n=1 Tax=Clytia hemisphaerica TaxID=252671 RepID=A0A7M5X618_9CNID